MEKNIFKRYWFIIALLLVAIMFISFFTFADIEKETTYHDLILGTVLTHVDGNLISPPIIFYNSRDPSSVRLLVVNYSFDGKAFNYSTTNKTILFNGGSLSKIAGWRGDVIWYDLQYKHEMSLFYGVKNTIIDAKAVKPTITMNLGENTSTLGWAVDPGFISCPSFFVVNDPSSPGWWWND